MKDAQLGGADLASLREKQAQLLLDINAVVAEIREAPAHTIADYLALLDVALEHEIDLAADIAFYGPEDYRVDIPPPMMAKARDAGGCPRHNRPPRGAGARRATDHASRTPAA